MQSKLNDEEEEEKMQCWERAQKLEVGEREDRERGRESRGVWFLNDFLLDKDFKIIYFWLMLLVVALFELLYSRIAIPEIRATKC